MGFAFECDCPRCDGDDGPWQLIEQQLEAPPPGLMACGQQERAQLMHTSRQAHASICTMQRNRGKPVGFGYREHESWAETLAAADAALPHILAAGSSFHWMAIHTRELKCRALEETKADSKAFLVLAEQVDILWRLLPKYCEGLISLQDRLEATRERIP